MKILIAGGTGFIGQALTKHFMAKRIDVIILGRSHKKTQDIYGAGVKTLTWDELTQSSQEVLTEVDLCINLAGANIADKRWIPKIKQEILDSRVKTTSLLAKYCAQLGPKSPPLFNASAVGIYGIDSLPNAHEEDQPVFSEKAPDFLSQVARAWEEATLIASQQGVRVVNMRFALVLGKGGLLNKLKLPYSLGLGGVLGSGNQPFSWIALVDLIAAIDFLISKSSIQGAVNFVSPECITQKQFAKAFAHALKRPCFLKMPASILQILLGKQMADELLLNGQCASPKILLTHGFVFKFPNIAEALAHILSQP